MKHTLTGILIREGDGFVALCPEVDVASQDTTVTVPVPNHRELRTGTLRAIIRQSGLTVDDFVS